MQRCTPVCLDSVAWRIRHSIGFLSRTARLLGLSAPAGACTMAGRRLTSLWMPSSSLTASLTALLILSWSMLPNPLSGAGMVLVLVLLPADAVLMLVLLLCLNSASRPPQAATASAAPSGLNARLVTRWPKAHAWLCQSRTL